MVLCVAFGSIGSHAFFILLSFRSSAAYLSEMQMIKDTFIWSWSNQKKQTNKTKLLKKHMAFNMKHLTAKIFPNYVPHIP